MRESAAYRRLWVGLSLGQVGQQLAVVAIGLQVYDLTRSSFAVGLVGLSALVPLVVLGLYGGAIVDARDRRTVAIAASVSLWVVSLATAAQAWLDVRSVPLLYALVALQSAAYAVNNPARAAIVPSLVSRHNLPAANALHTLSFTIGAAVGPALGGFVVGRWGVEAAYTVDAVTYLFALWGVFGLPAMPPEPTADGVRRRAGLASVVEGLRFLGGRPNIRMTFFVDMAAMFFAMPRALFPAIGVVVLGGGATTAGALVSAIAGGSILAGLLSGPLGTVRRQGLAVVACVVGWGLSVAAFGACLLAAGGTAGVVRAGVSPWLWPALGCLVVAGAMDAVSAVFRQTILQAATPDALRGRLQGVFIVVVAGGPRVGDLVSGTSGDAFGEAAAACAGGLVCVAAALFLARLQPRFVHYDARHPEP
nr:MFS transporter [Kineosporia sp. A_224]